MLSVLSVYTKMRKLESHRCLGWELLCRSRKAESLASPVLAGRIFLPSALASRRTLSFAGSWCVPLKDPPNSAGRIGYNIHKHLKLPTSPTLFI